MESYIFETKETKKAESGGKNIKGNKDEKSSEQKVVVRLQVCAFDSFLPSSNNFLFPTFLVQSN